jgi:arsenite methyltransferase
MSQPDDIRKQVSQAYAKALSQPGGGCCSTPLTQLGSKSSCCSPPTGGVEPCGAISQAAGYRASELSGLPGDAVQNSFGCGNPLAYSGVAEGDVVLDLGSGAGIDILLAADKVGPSGRVIGVDMTDEMIERARANIAAAGVEQVEVRKGVIEQLPVDTASVDWVISNCVINLSPEKERVFAEIARVLRPGGQMLVSDLVVEDLPDWIRQSAQAYAACVAGAISEADYLGGLRAAGLEAVEVRDRLIYDVDQILGFIDSEEGRALLGQTDIRDAVMSQVVGKVASVKVYARKPG